MDKKKRIIISGSLFFCLFGVVPLLYMYIDVVEFDSPSRFLSWIEGLGIAVIGIVSTFFMFRYGKKKEE